jgi:hypothetical protein
LPETRPKSALASPELPGTRRNQLSQLWQVRTDLNTFSAIWKGVSTPCGIRPPPPCKYNEVPNTHSLQKPVYNLSFTLSSPHPPHSSSALHGRRIDDSEALEGPGWLGQPITATHPDWVSPGHLRFRVSRDLAGVSCVSRF